MGSNLKGEVNKLYSLFLRFFKRHGFGKLKKDMKSKKNIKKNFVQRIASLRFIVLLCCSLSLTSCFEIIHEMDLKKDGSGTLNIVINFSRSKSKIDMLLLLDEINGHRVPTLTEINQKVNIFTDTIKQSKGFSNVRSHFDRENYILDFSCNFSDVNTLNKRIYQSWLNAEPEKASYKSYYKYSAMTFHQNLGEQAMELYTNMPPADREVLIGADYTSILRFENEIRSQSNPAAIIAANKKVIILRSAALKLIQNPKLFNNAVNLIQ